MIKNKMSNHKNKIIFITGGAKSGKSSLALKPASLYSVKKAYIATAEPLDAEMLERIDRHKRQRGLDWDVFEEPLKIGDSIKKIMGEYPFIIIDCLTLWVSNLLTRQDNERFIEKELQKLITVLDLFHNNYGSQLIIVSNEVGMGIVPDNTLSRRFMDIAGMLNQKVAEIADEVYLTVSGIPVKIKG